MVKKKTFYAIFLLLVVVFAGIVSSLSVQKTIINIHAGKYNNLTIIISKPSDGSILETKSDFANQEGEFSYTHYALVPKIDIKIEIRDLNGNLLGTQEFGPYDSGSPISLTIDSSNLGEIITDSSSGPSDDSSNDVAPEESSITDESTITDDVPGVTGFAVSDGASSSNVGYYILAVIFVGGLLLLGGLWHYKKGSFHPHSKIKKNFSTVDSGNSVDLRKAQKRISQLESEVTLLKNQDRIKDLQKSINKEQDEISRLRRGD